MPLEDDDLTTLTVTIALDDDNGDLKHGHEDHGLPQASYSMLEKFYVIRSPISPERACPFPSKNLVVSDLPMNAQKLLCSKLNAPAIGSMKNWLYLSALLGVVDDEISTIRRLKDPMMKVLEIISEISLVRLINVIGDIGRIDVLLSLRPFLHGLSAAGRKPVQKAVPARNMQIPLNAGFDSAITESLRMSSFQFPTKKFIVVTYHETDKIIKKNVKLLLLALQSIAEKCNFEILDIAKCIDETNISQTALNLFKHAAQIVLFISSPDYISNISNSINPNDNNNNAIKTVKKLFHCWMDEEYHSNGCRNLRFRVILNKSVLNRNEVLPGGWPQSTLQYTFPGQKQFEEICKRLFE